MRPSTRAARLEFSPTLALDARAKELERAGEDVVSMAVGEPDFAPPAAAREAAKAAIDGNRVRYTPVAGTPELRRAIAAQSEATRGTRWDPEREVCVCSSAKHALSSALLCLLEPGDEVLLPLPAWSSYGEEIRLAEGVPVGIAPRPDLGPDLAALSSAVSARTRGVLLNTPCNPSGYAWSAAEIRALVELAARADLWILSDEIYRRLIYEGEPHLSPAAVSEDSRRRTFVVDGASKAYAMTGYRIGYLAGPEPIVSAVATLNSQTVGCPSAVSQAGYRAVLEREPAEVAAMAAEFDRRRRFLLEGLDALGLDTPRARGAFYVFPSVAPWTDGRGASGFCEDLLDEERLAAVPGGAFGHEGSIRLSYATSLERIEEALRRLERFLARRADRALSGR